MIQSKWVPDDEGQGCSICHSDFGITRRRHHCRKCGALVCGSCSDHFVLIPGHSDGEVRVCDNCELALREGGLVSEKMDINAQITDSLKDALKEKAGEIALFNAFLLHVLEEPGECTPERLERFRAIVTELCGSLSSYSEQYGDLKDSSNTLEREIRGVAQRCLRAEEKSREAIDIQREIEEYASQIGEQSRLIDQLNERISRLRSRSPERRELRGLRSSSPSREIERLDRAEPTLLASMCQIAKSLLSLRSFLTQ